MNTTDILLKRVLPDLKMINKIVCQELFIELENCLAQLMQKNDELLEVKEKVQFLQEKNRAVWSCWVSSRTES